MTTRKRIRTINPTVSGGGQPQPCIASVVWGPQFGDNEAEDFAVGATIDLEAIALVGTLGAGEQITMPALAADYSNGSPTVGVQILMTALALQATLGVGARITMPALALTGSLGVGAQILMTALKLTGTLTVGATMTGTVLGPPFWQSAATAVLGGATVTTDTDLTVGNPSGLVVGNFMLAFLDGIGVAAVPVITAVSAGWTALVTSLGSGNQQSQAFWKFADAADVAGSGFTFRFSIIGGMVLATGEVHRITGVDVTTPVDAADVSPGGGTADPDAPTVTTTVANTLVFAHLGHDHLALSQSHTPPAGHVERSDFQDGTTVFLGSTTADRVFAAAGATGLANFNCTEVVGTNFVTYRVALRPTSFAIS